MTRLTRFAAVALAAAFVALHLPFLPASLEDLDSINFALGVRDFDVTRHQPHPPGYPVFIVAAKLVHAIVPTEAHALSLLGILCGGFAVLALVLLFREIEGGDDSLKPFFATLLVATSPLFYLTAARPLSDVAGLAAALGVHVLILRASTPRALAIASLLAAVGAGIRSQVAWLTLPLLAFAIVRRPHAERVRNARFAIGGYLAGAALWAIPLVALTGGPATYVRTLFNQGAEDFSGVVMLWTTPTPRQLVRVLEAAFVGPWSFVPTALIVLVFATIGFLDMLRRRIRTLGMLAIAFGPYLLFDLVFQEAATTRYALPLVIPVSYAAVRGLWSIAPRLTAPAIAGMAAFNVFVTTSALTSYAQLPAPAFRLLDDMRTTAASRRPAPVLAMHRRYELDLRRPLLWEADRMPAFDRRLPSPIKHEWLELVKYWNSGGRQPVWFVADPTRTDLTLIRRERQPAEYRWPFNLPTAIGGVRPNEMDWYIVNPPDWYLGEGWSLTPETGGLAREDRRGPSQGGAHGWIRRWPTSGTVVIGGRNLADGASPARLRVEVDGRAIDETVVQPGFFLRMVPLPATAAGGSGDYAAITVTSDRDQLALEQFDAGPEGHAVFGYGDGWNEQEANQSTGRLWRWTTERATLRVRSERRPLLLSLIGEIEEASTSHITIRAGDRVVAEHDVGRTFSVSTKIPAELVADPETSIVIETSAWYIPAERRWRSQDRRHLGLKIYSCQLSPAS